MSWSDGALLVSTVAASGAALFAFLTVKDTRHFHDQQEEERKLDGLLAVTRTVSEIADTAVRVGSGAHGLYGLLHSQQQRLKVELAALPDFDLPISQTATKKAEATDELTTLSAIVGPVASRAQNALPELEEAVRTHVRSRGST
jgi:hypothetical protein